MSNCLNFWCSIRDTCIYRDSTKGCSDISFCKVFRIVKSAHGKRTVKEREEK